MKKKVIHLIGHLKTGGAENLITDYALNIDNEKFEILIVILGNKKDTFNERLLKENNVRMIFLGEKQLFSQPKNLIKRFLNKIHRYNLFRRVVKKEKPNIIHSHLMVIKYLIPLKTKNIKLYYTIHSEVDKLFGKRRYLFKGITSFCIKRKGMIPIALHSRMQTEMNNLFNIDNSIVLKNPIDMERFSPLKYKNVKGTLELDKDSFVIGHVGRFVEAKNHFFLIEVFYAIKKIRSNAHLLLIGTGELENEVKKYVTKLKLDDSVTFLGNRYDIPELMSAMDVFVFPSIREGFGNVLIEAQTMGLRCVVSDKVPSDAFITNLVTSISLNTPIEVWRDTILDNHKKINVIGNIEEHDIKNIIKQLEELYESNYGS
ncbi:glycosyltransferase [Ralstonia pickettii]|nr:glycosyltransferase [Ralstonia pickettii]